MLKVHNECGSFRDVPKLLAKQFMNYLWVFLHSVFVGFCGGLGCLIN